MATAQLETAPLIVRDTGLTVLRDPSNSIADIVFVHGLQGHPRRTWTCKAQTNSVTATDSSLAPRIPSLRRFKALISRQKFVASDENHKPEAEVFWPLDLLPQDCANARILTWGYESNISRFFAGPANQNTIFAHARDLLYALGNNRRDCQTRNLIFVAHSLGGIIIKDVLRRAADEQDTSLVNVFKATTAVLFLGTPHRGSSKADTGEMMRKIAYASGFNTNGRNLQALQINSPELEIVHEGFMKLFQRNPRPFEVCTFQEAQGLTGVSYLGLGEKVVDDVSSSFTGTERCQTINANHMSMCRFDSNLDAGYEKVVGELKNLLSTIGEDMEKKKKKSGGIGCTSPTVSSVYSLNDIEKLCIRLFNTSDIAEYKSFLPTRVEGTCQWILSDPQYLRWYSEGKSSLLWINGHPGSGKTILSAYLLDYLSANKSLDLRHTVCAFFCDEKIESQRDGKAILRSLIYQILTRQRKLIRHVKAAYEIQGPDLLDNFNELWRIFMAITTDKRLGSMSIIIDAIDECEDSTRVRLLMGIATIIREAQLTTTSDPQCIKFLLTSRPLISRHYPLSHLQIKDLDQNTVQDLRLVIQRKIEEIARRTNCRSETRAYLENTLYSKADQTFLWVALVLQVMEKTPLASQKDFQRMVEDLPKGLAAIYERFLYNIPTEYQKVAALLLHFIAGSLRPLSLDEIRILLALTYPQQSIASIEVDSQPNMRETIESILGPLVRISEGRVYFVHQTAKDFLNSLYKRRDHPLSKPYGIDQVNANLLIARCCILYLLLNDFDMDIFAQDQDDAEDSPTSPLRTSEVEDLYDIWDELELGNNIFMRDHDIAESEHCSLIANKYAFFDYSAVHWTRHFALCSATCPEDLQRLALELLQSGANKFSNWFRYYWCQREMNLAFPTTFNPFITACFFGHLTTIEFLADIEALIDVDTATCGLFWASYKGHPQVVSRLLHQHTPPNREMIDHQTSLIVAARFDHFDVVQLLIEAEGINVNSKGKGGRTALSVAAGNGHLAIVERLLGHQTIQPNVPDSSGWTPIFWAVGGKYLEIVRRLSTDNALNINHTDNEGRNVLSWAAEAGEADIVKFLLAQDGIDVQQRDLQGQTALSWAVRSGNIDVVSMLRRSKRIDISGKDNEGRNAISWAAAGGHHDVVEYLIKHDPTGADKEDDNGWTPLAWALDRDSPNTAQVLLSSGMVDPNYRDKNGRTPLSWAAGYGYMDVVKKIMNTKGVIVDAQDNEGRTASAWARQYNFIEVAEMIEGIQN